MGTKSKLEILHNISPQWLRNSLGPVFQCTYLHCFLFSSRADADNRICMAYFGMNRARARVWAKRICGEHYWEAEDAPRIWYWGIEAYLEEEFADCNLRLIETCALTERILAGKPGFKIPMWIQLALDTTKSV